MDEEFISKILTIFEAELQKQKLLYSAIINISQAAIEQGNLKSLALLAVLREQQKQPEAEQGKVQKQEQPEAKQSKEQ